MKTVTLKYFYVFNFTFNCVLSVEYFMSRKRHLVDARQKRNQIKSFSKELSVENNNIIVEFLKDFDDPLKTTDKTKSLGLSVCREIDVMLVSPTDGSDAIANPFQQPDGSESKFVDKNGLYVC